VETHTSGCNKADNDPWRRQAPRDALQLAASESLFQADAMALTAKESPLAHINSLTQSPLSETQL